jgi:hypothetical protein
LWMTTKPWAVTVAPWGAMRRHNWRGIGTETDTTVADMPTAGAPFFTEQRDSLLWGWANLPSWICSTDGRAGAWLFRPQCVGLDRHADVALGRASSHCCSPQALSPVSLPHEDLRHDPAKPAPAAAHNAVNA